MSLYRGLIPALSGIIPYAGVDLAVYSWLKDKYVSNNPSSFALLGTVSSFVELYTPYFSSLFLTPYFRMRSC